MSGGHFDYRDQQLTYEIFGMYPEYDLESRVHKVRAKLARREARLRDLDISELAYDLLCLIHSFDYYVSCDTSEETYRFVVTHVAGMIGVDILLATAELVL